MTHEGGGSVSAEEQIEPASELVSFIVVRARPVHGKHLYALVDVEMRIADVSFWILGVQARRLPQGGGTSVHLPTCKDTGGTWRAAVKLPDELCAPLADTVLEFLLEEGLARPKYFAG
jgi:hypothetical protein